jgi:hypothetical protein
VVTAAAGGAVGWLAIADSGSSHEPLWPAYVLASVAVLGLYWLLAPLLRWWPWADTQRAARVRTRNPDQTKSLERARAPQGAALRALRRGVDLSAQARDVFVSHASEDKQAIARPLADALLERGFTVWFDEYELVLGDSLRGKIDDGLARSTIGVVILSHAFFAKPWPRRELDGLTARLMNGENNVIVPIWHDLTDQDLLRYSPPLADLLAGNSAEGVDTLVDRIERVLALKAEALRLPTASVVTSPGSLRLPTPGYRIVRGIRLPMARIGRLVERLIKAMAALPGVVGTIATGTLRGLRDSIADHYVHLTTVAVATMVAATVILVANAPEDRANIARSGAIRIPYTNSWRLSSNVDPSSTLGLSLSDSMLLRNATFGAGFLATGFLLNGSHGSDPLPAAVAGAFRSLTGPRDVKLKSVEALQFSGKLKSGPSFDLYLIPTPAGWATAICSGATAQFPALRRRCEALVAHITFVGLTPQRVGADPHYALQIQRAITQASSTRRRWSANLAAHSLNVRAAAARMVAHAYATCAARIAKLSTTLRSESANREISGAAKSVADAFGELASASHAKEAARYRAANALVKTAQHRLRAKLHALDALGYHLVS